MSTSRRAGINRKIDAMHSLFGVLPGKRCEECEHLIQGDYHGVHLRKCTVYGATHSAATDWRKKYEACGLFNQPYNGAAVIDILKCSSKKVEDLQPIDGQMVMEADNG